MAFALPQNQPYDTHLHDFFVLYALDHKFYPNHYQYHGLLAVQYKYLKNFELYLKTYYNSTSNK